MKILLTGATGYIGKRLLPFLIEQGQKVICCVRDKNRFQMEGISLRADFGFANGEGKLYLGFGEAFYFKIASAYLCLMGWRKMLRSIKYQLTRGLPAII
jgi:Male sterility protein